MPEVVGREAELAEIRTFIEAVPSGPHALVMEGEAGIGKTVLFETVVASAESLGYTVLRCLPAESEARLSYSGWMDLLRDVGDAELGRLPDPQWRGLEVALLRRSSGEEPVDHRAVSAGALGVLRLLADRSPVLVAIDDQHWLDPQSASLVGYCTRRLREEPVGLLGCGRLIDGRSDPLGIGAALGEERLRHIVLRALEPDAIGMLLVRRLGLTLPYPTILRIHEAVAGNPLYALEVGRAVLGADGRMDHEIPVPGEVRDLVRSRIASLDPGAREVVEISSGCARPTGTILRSILGAEAALEQLRRAEMAGVIVSDGDDVRFAHPLFAAAAYAGMSSPRRRQIHAWLAAVVPDTEERARHLGLGSDPPDQTVATALAAEAVRAAGRGAPIAAAELFEEAARFTPADRADDVHRLSMLAADQHYISGDHPRAIELLEKTIASASEGAARTEALLRLGRLMFYWDLPRAADILGDAVRGPGRAQTLSAIRVMRAWVALHLLDTETAVGDAHEAVRLSEEAEDPETFVTAVTTACCMDPLVGRRADRRLLDRALALEPSVRPALAADRPSFASAQLLQDAGAFDDARRIYRAMLDEARDRGDEMSVTDMLLNLAELEFVTGDWDASLAYAGEMYRFDVEVGYPTVVPASSIAIVEGHRGSFDAARAHAAEAVAAVGHDAGQGHGIRELHALIAGGTVELAAGDAGAASGHLLRAWDRLSGSGIGHPREGWFLADLAEALVRCGRSGEVDPLAAWLEERGRGLDDETALGLAARVRGLAAASSGDPSGALAKLEEATDHHRGVDVPFERARTLLALGTTRRHGKVKAAAREALKDARAIFERLGATPWLVRVDAELASIGGRRPAPAGGLTPTEERVARLATAGRTNREIADALFLSVRTVESHLSHAYAKLGVRSRTELGAILGRLEGPA